MSGLPDRPDLDQLRRQARELLRAAADGEPHAGDRLRAVSPSLTLSAAQLALAREYGFTSWAALKAEVARRRSPGTPTDRWSFAGTSVLRTPAGVLLPEILIAGASQATLHASSTPSAEGQLAAAVPRRRRLARGALRAWLVPRRNARVIRERRAKADAAAAVMRALLTTISLVDDRGARYALRGGRSAGRVGAPDRFVHLRVHPAPGREVTWIEVRGQDGATARLLSSPRAAARIGQLRPVQLRPVPVTAAGLIGVPGAAPRPDGPWLHLDIGVGLPAVDGVTIRLDSLISLPGSWQLYLRAQPRWRNYSRAGQRAEDPVSVHAEDDHHGIYRASHARNTGLPSDHELAEERVMEPEELALQFLPSLDPLARSVRLTFQGPHEEVTVDLEIGPTTTP